MFRQFGERFIIEEGNNGTGGWPRGNEGPIPDRQIPDSLFA